MELIFPNLFLIQINRTGSRLIQTHEQLHQRALACPVMPDDRHCLPAFDGKADIIDYLTFRTKIGKGQILYPKLLYLSCRDSSLAVLLYFGLMFQKFPEVANVHGVLVQLEKAVLLLQQRFRHAEHRHDYHKPVTDHHIFKHQNTESSKQDDQIISHPCTYRIHEQPVYRTF